MDRLILVKHSHPEIRAGIPAAEWILSADGRTRCVALADRLAAFRPFRLFSSREVKAQETATLVSDRLGVPWSTVEGLHEHERASVELLPQAEFERSVKALFERPDDRVFGEETAATARARFGEAIDGLLDQRGEEDTVVVSHGTVISLLLAERAAVEPFALWKSLGLPSYVVLSLPGWRVEAVVSLDAEKR